MSKRRKVQGRKKGSRNKGYFYYAGRGWFVLNEGKKVPLCYDDGERIRNKDESPKVVDEAYHRWRQSKKEERNRAQEDAPKSNRRSGSGQRISHVCRAARCSEDLQGSL